MRARVELLAGYDISQVVALEREVVTIGKSPDRDIQLGGLGVARAHAELRATPSGHLLTDLGSGQETLLDDEPLRAHQPTPLRDGAVIAVGAHRLIYRVERVPAPPPPRDDREAPTDRYLRYLPGVYQGHDFLARFLRVFETLWEPHERRQDHIERYLDPRTAPAALLPWLARWTGLELPDSLPEERMRMVLAESVDLCRWRGTMYGLERLLELATGELIKVQEDPERPFVVRIIAPSNAERGVIEGLVRAHKPAYMAHMIEGGR